MAWPAYFRVVVPLLENNALAFVVVIPLQALVQFLTKVIFRWMLNLVARVRSILWFWFTPNQRGSHGFRAAGAKPTQNKFSGGAEPTFLPPLLIKILKAEGAAAPPAPPMTTSLHQTIVSFAIYLSTYF